MSDPYNTAANKDKQSLRILNEHKSQNRLSDDVLLDRQVEEVKSHNTESIRVAARLLDELEEQGFRFNHCRTSGAGSRDTIEPVIYDAHFGVWKPLYQRQNKWEVLLRADADLKGTLDQRIYLALLSEAEDRCYHKSNPVDFDKPLFGVCFENGIFDLDTGKLRNYRPDDYRQFQGRTTFDTSSGYPSEVLNLIGHMAGGDSSKEKLIRAACYLNICGIHTLPAFKSAFFIWACEDGYGGRSSLFNVINKASGGDAAVTLSHLADLTDNNTLLRLRGRNYCYIDECQDVSSARSKAIATLKNITGGVTRLEVWQKHKDKFEIEGHWIVNQAFNGMELLYAADRALLDRCVPIVTQRIPESAQLEYRLNPQKQADLVSDAQCSWFLRLLWEEFGHPANAAEVVDRVKKEFESDLDQLVSKTDPLSEFAEEFLPVTPGAITPVAKVLDAFNGWLKQTYPTHRPVNIRNLTSGLRKSGIQVDRLKVDGALTTCVFGRETSGALHLLKF
jgi:hypothetical protein